MKFKQFLLTVLIASLIIPLNVQAVTPNFSQKLKNITQFLNSFVDLDSSLNYWSDSLKSNPCIKRDVMSLHAQKDEISDQMLHEYTTLTEAELDQLKIEYALLDSELTFVRHALDTEVDLRRKVIDRANKKVKVIVRDQYLDEWLTNKYAGKRGIEGEYTLCPNAWSEVSETWKGLSQKIQLIKEESKAFGQQFTATVNEASTVPGTVYNSIGPSVRESRTNLRDNLSESLRNAQETLARNGVSQSDYSAQVQAEYDASNSRQDVASVLETETNLTLIPEILSESDAEVEQVLDEGLQNAKIDLLARYQDSLTLQFWSVNEEINQNLDGANTLISAEPNGLTSLFTEVGDRQCR